MDRLSPAARSRNMSRIRSTGMKPERYVRSAAHRLGYRFRLHRKDLPGKPDLVFPSRRKIIFVHGCFWHQHPKEDCKDSRLPKSNKGYWSPKLARNVERDEQNIRILREQGWDVLVIWECEVSDQGELARKVHGFLR